MASGTQSLGTTETANNPAVSVENTQLEDTNTNQENTVDETYNIPPKGDGVDAILAAALEKARIADETKGGASSQQLLEQTKKTLEDARNLLGVIQKVDSNNS